MEFGRAHLVVKRDKETSDILNVRFKKYTNPYEENSIVSFSGNVRSYSERLACGKNKVELYVFTYFDQPDLDENDQEYTNFLELDGRICKIDAIRKTKNGRKSIHLIIANNLIVSDGSKKLNSYVPCIAWGEVAEKLSTLPVGEKISVVGKLHSREYKKTLEDGSFEFRVAHEVEIEDFQLS